MDRDESRLLREPMTLTWKGVLSIGLICLVLGVMLGATLL